MRNFGLLVALFIPITAQASPYGRIVERVAEMVNDTDAQLLLARRKLEMLSLTWEDTGRSFGSSVGPNISDVTIEVQEKTKNGVTTRLMPVIRHDNYSDLTGDVALDKIRIPVGNHTAGPLTDVTLRQLLADPTRYLSNPQAGTIKHRTLLAPRDTHALVSAQTAFLPVPHEGKATFWPVIFNYQSTQTEPAVLTILVTRQGASMTIIDNARDTVPGASWGQRLFFNDHGQRAPLTAERLSDVESHGTTMNGESAAQLSDNANLLMLIQVPLKIHARPRIYKDAEEDALAGSAGDDTRSTRRGGRDMETAVLGHGPKLGPYTELGGHTIERDPRFPVRVTVQFYQATSTGTLTNAQASAFAKQIRRVYRDADYVGSLVVPTRVDFERPTLWTGAH